MMISSLLRGVRLLSISTVVGLTLFWSPQTAAAASYENIFVTPTDPDAYTTIDEPFLLRAYHGTLEGFPHTYRLVLESTQDVTFTFVLPTHQKQQPNFSVLVVTQATSGVTELWRESSTEMAFTRDYVARTGDTYLVGDTFTRTLDPGTYYIEVSNGDNEGKYVMRFGFDPVPYNLGYGAALRDALATKHFFGTSSIRALMSPFYYIPGFLLLLCWYLWRRYRKMVGE